MFKKPILAAVAVLLAVGAAVFLPNFIRGRTHPAENACVNILRQIDGAKHQWALENGKTTNDTPSSDDLRPHIRLGPQGELPRCPEGGTFILGRVGELPRCSIGGYHSLPQ